MGDPIEKNDQAWVEQKNGAVVRRLVGHRRLEGIMLLRRAIEEAEQAHMSKHVRGAVAVRELAAVAARAGTLNIC